MTPTPNSGVRHETAYPAPFPGRARAGCYSTRPRMRPSPRSLPAPLPGEGRMALINAPASTGTPHAPPVGTGLEAAGFPRPPRGLGIPEGISVAVGDSSLPRLSSRLRARQPGRHAGQEPVDKQAPLGAMGSNAADHSGCRAMRFKHNLELAMHPRHKHPGSEAPTPQLEHG